MLYSESVPTTHVRIHQYHDLPAVVRQRGGGVTYDSDIIFELLRQWHIVVACGQMRTSYDVAMVLQQLSEVFEVGWWYHAP